MQNSDAIKNKITNVIVLGKNMSKDINEENIIDMKMNFLSFPFLYILFEIQGAIMPDKPMSEKK